MTIGTEAVWPGPCTALACRLDAALAIAIIGIADRVVHCPAVRDHADSPITG
jgi:hypothetical protein